MKVSQKIKLNYSIFLSTKIQHALIHVNIQIVSKSNSNSYKYIDT